MIFIFNCCLILDNAQERLINDFKSGFEKGEVVSNELKGGVFYASSSSSSSSSASGPSWLNTKSSNDAPRPPVAAAGV
jgi:hypothetical protein